MPRGTTEALPLARLGNPDFMTADELTEIVLFCWKQPVSICIRDIVVAATRTRS